MSHINSLQNTAATTSASSESEPRSVNQEDAQAFDNMSKEVSEHKKNTHGEQESYKNTPGDSILFGMLGQQGKGTAQVEAAAKLNATMPNEELLHKLVDSIMVGTGENKQEVHLKVNNSILTDTNIVLRMEEGKLFVQLQTGNADSALTLHQNSEALQTRLMASCKDTEVNVKIVEQSNPKEGQNQERNDSQSRGHFLWENEA